MRSHRVEAGKFQGARLPQFVSCTPHFLEIQEETWTGRPARRRANALRRSDEKTVTQEKRKCGSDQEGKRTHRIGLFIGGKERSICQGFHVDRERKRYGSQPRMEQGKCITLDVRQKGVRCIASHHLRGTRILVARGFMRAGCHTGLARMRQYTTDTQRGGQYHCP